VVSLFRLYLRYRALTGQVAFDLTPPDLMMRMAALNDVRDWQREDTYRAVASAGAEMMTTGGEDLKKVYL
jgi:hypothetical protein